MNTRQKVLHILNSFFPIKVKGDAVFNNDIKYELSCIINFYKRTDLLNTILHCLSDQDFDKNKFEVILVEDRGGSNEGKQIADKFKSKINIKYYTLDKNFGVMGYSRNFALSKSSGKYILFLDDDTVILQSNFISTLMEIIKQTNADGIMPRGTASYGFIKNHYQYHDPYYPTNRCMAYNRNTLKDMGGFISSIIGQEDVELYIRLITQNKKIIKTDKLGYFHPPLIYNDYNKGKAVGYSFYNLKKKYPFPVWIMILINGCRYVPLVLLSFIDKHKHKSNFSIGFLLGIYESMTGSKPQYN